jgi:hypothetical protein
MVGVVAMISTVAAPADAEEVTVEVSSKNPNVTLNRVVERSFAQASGPGGTATAAGVSYTMACVWPCNKRLDRQAMYFVSGRGVTESESFVLPQGDRVRLDVDAGSKSKRAMGIILTPLGITAAVVGGALMAVEDYRTTGAVIGVVGLAALIPGIIFLATSGTTVTAGGTELARGPAPRVALGPQGLVF